MDGDGDAIVKKALHRISLSCHHRRKHFRQFLLGFIAEMMPRYPGGDIDVVVCHALVVRRIHVAYMHKGIAHFVLSAVDESVDNRADALVAHDMNVKGQPPRIGFAGNFRQIFFLPVGDSLAAVEIQRIYKTGAAFHRAVQENLYPSGNHPLGSEFLGVHRPAKRLVHIHPAFDFIRQARHEVQFSGLVHLLEGLVVVVVHEIVAPALVVHGVPFRQHTMLDVGEVRQRHVEGIQVLMVYELAHIGLGLFRQKTGRSSVGADLDHAAAEFFFQHRAVFLHNARVDQHQGVRYGLVAFIVQEVNGNIAANGVNFLAGRDMGLEARKIPALAKDRFRAAFPCLLDGGGKDFRHELLRIRVHIHHGADRLQGVAQHIMGVAVAAAGHHKPLPGVVHHFGLAVFHKIFGALPVADIDIFAVLHGKRFFNPVVFGREYLAVDNEVGRRSFSLFCRATAYSRNQQKRKKRCK